MKEEEEEEAEGGRGEGGGAEVQAQEAGRMAIWSAFQVHEDVRPGPSAFAHPLSPRAPQKQVGLQPFVTRRLHTGQVSDLTEIIAALVMVCKHTLRGRLSQCPLSSPEASLPP